MTDIWVCGTCHSINRQRGSVCYKCGAPQSGAINAIADVRTEQAIQTRASVPYRSSFLRAVVAAGLIVAYAVLTVVALFESLALTQYVRDQIPMILQGELDSAEILRLAAPAVVPALLQTIFGIGALVFFAAWLSRVVMNVPALGGGTPGTTPTKAFVYPLIPFWNLFKTPPMIQDALYRLDPKAGGFFMVLVAWVGLVGSAIIGFLAGWWVNLRIATLGGARSLGEAITVVQGAYDMQLLVDIATTLMSAFGAIVLVLILFRVESRARARDREIRKAAAAPRAEPGTVAARPGGMSWEMTAAAAAAQANATTRSQPPMPPGAPAPTSATAPEGAHMVPGPLGFVPAPSRVPTGPRLHLRVQGPDAMTATLDGESEAITLAELPEAAQALARANGSAVVATAGAGTGAASLAEEAFKIFTAAGVPTSTEG